MTRVAAIQLNASDDQAQNLRKTAKLVAEAKREGAVICVLPECFALMPRDDAQRKQAGEHRQGGGLVESALSRMASQFSMWIISAGIYTTADREGLVRNSSFVHDSQGKQIARYDKIHRFDVALPDGEQYSESRYTEPGDRLEVVDTPAGAVGLSICYDVRFPQLYRRLCESGATWLVVPSAFSRTTGHAHWEVLLRARAIENVAYVVAPALHGEHPGGRQTYGHSMIVDPWGTVVAVQAHGDGVVVWDLDAERIESLRASFPGCLRQACLRQSDG